jgi:hypothetical protein
MVDEWRNRQVNVDREMNGGMFDGVVTHWMRADGGMDGWIDL